MKVLFVAPYLSFTYGGVTKVVIEVAEALRSQQISVDLIATNANDTGHLDLPLNRWIEHSNYRTRYFRSWHRNDFIISPSLTNWLFKNIINYDIVHTHTIFSPLISLAHWVCQYHKIPYIMTPHGMLDPWALSYKARKKHFYYNLLEKPALRQASAIQVLASSEAEQLQSLGFQNSIVVPNGIHQQQFETLPDPELFYQKFPETRNKSLILFLGRIDP